MAQKVLAQMALTRSWGGLEMMALQYAENFRDRGYTPHMITVDRSPLQEIANSKKIDLFTLPESRYVAPSASRKLRQYIDREGINTVFVHRLRDLWLLCPALWGRPDVEVIGFAHIFLQDIRKNDVLHRWLYSRLKYLVALTELQKQELLRCLPVSPDQVVVVPNGIDFHKFSPDKRSEHLRQRLFNVRREQKVIGVVGRLDPQKGQLEFLRATCRVLEKSPDTVFALIGRPTNEGLAYTETLLRFIEQNQLTEHIRLIDHMDDISQAMACLDVFVLPSYREAFGNVLIEAMASGVPVIATDAGGPSETVQSGLTGLLIPPKDDRAMANAMLTLLNQPELARKLAQNALQFGQEKYDVPQVLDTIEGIVTGHTPVREPRRFDAEVVARSASL